MSNKKDMRRVDLIIPYQSPTKNNATDMSSTMASTLPLAAMFTRNKFIGWAALVFAIQTWLGESQEGSGTAQPAIMSVGMSFMALLVTYLPIFLNPEAASGTAGTSTEAPAAQPPS